MPPASTIPRATRGLERGPGRARVAPDEDAARRPDQSVAARAEALDEILGQRLADDAPDAVGPEVASSSGLTFGHHTSHVRIVVHDDEMPRPCPRESRLATG